MEARYNSQSHLACRVNLSEVEGVIVAHDCEPHHSLSDISEKVSKNFTPCGFWLSKK